jgi:hypothetical protein
MEEKTRIFEEIHRSLGGPCYLRFIKLILSPQILLNKSVNAYYIIGYHHPDYSILGYSTL